MAVLGLTILFSGPASAKRTHRKISKQKVSVSIPPAGNSYWDTLQRVKLNAPLKVTLNEWSKKKGYHAVKSETIPAG